MDEDRGACEKRKLLRYGTTIDTADYLSGWWAGGGWIIQYHRSLLERYAYVH